MGLDMFLKRKKYIGGNYAFNNVEGIIDVTSRGKKIPIDLKKVSYIDEEIGYWRKANAIHKWFVDNVQEGNDDCKNYEVSIEELEKLLKLCESIKEKAKIDDEGNIINAEEIASILPTESGFFFGSTDYDKYYMEDIDYTIKMLKEVLKEEEEYDKAGICTVIEYTAWW